MYKKLIANTKLHFRGIGFFNKKNFHTSIKTFNNTMITNDIKTEVNIDNITSEMNNTIIPKRPVIKIDYTNKLILAPMVRVNGLAFRQICADFGADIVYSEELVDKKLFKCKPVINQKLNTIDYMYGDTIVYQVEIVSPESKSRTGRQEVPTVLQLGTSSPSLALEVAELMIDGYDAIDVNMGCPKKFSIKGGMGSSLLKKENQENALEILRTLVKGIKEKYGKPVTCKIRLLDTMEETLDLYKRLEATGVSAICVHARYIPQRPREKAHSHLIASIAEIAKIPLIANGDVFKQEDFERIKEVTKCNSLMIARGAMWNCSIFRKEGALDKVETAKQLLSRLKYYSYHEGLSKYILKRMFETQPKTKLYEALSKSKGFEQLEKALEVDEKIVDIITPEVLASIVGEKDETIEETENPTKKIKMD
ncbi:hypothetical protein ABK040_013779 [Willaertia magna]